MIDLNKLSFKELKRLKKANDKEIKSKQFNKKVVDLIIWMNIIFTAVIVFLFYKTGSEPSTLIEKWFKFTGTEMVALAGIKVADTAKEMVKIWKGVRGDE